MTANTDRTSKTDDERIKDITVLPPPEHLIRGLGLRNSQTHPKNHGGQR